MPSATADRQEKVQRLAPRSPGVTPTWADANKAAIAAAISTESRVWLSVADGSLTEVFFPTPDQACIRALSFVVTDGASVFIDDATDAKHVYETAAPDAVPVTRVISTCRGRYRLEKEILPDPLADVVLMQAKFTAEENAPSRYRLFVIVEPVFEDQGQSSAHLEERKGRPFFMARSGHGLALALASSTPWKAASVGFAGTSDGKTDLRAHKRLTERYTHALRGNVAFAAELDPVAAHGGITLALGFGRNTGTAAQNALGSLVRGYASARTRFVEEWERWMDRLKPCRLEGKEPPLWRRSLTVLKTLEAKGTVGGRVAALSTPWGSSKKSGTEGTYHLVWTRDLVESLGALLAAGAHEEARGALSYLECTQEADGRWPQNMLLNGDAVWNKDELDETALPLVLFHLVLREKLWSDEEIRHAWPMVKKAAEYVAKTGPSTRRDRWEDTRGVTPFSISAAIVALLVASEVADTVGDPALGASLRARADDWNASIDSWLYRRGGKLADHVGVDGYYVRAHVRGDSFESDLDLDRLPTTEISPDALALVRFGLRAPDDPRIVDTVRVIDAILKTEFPCGPCWRRYPGDEYGEHPDGRAFDGHGIGRPWPLLTGERAHYELMCGRTERAESLRRTMAAFAGTTGLLPEQVWDAEDIASRGLVRGAASGSANPLGWAHAEYVKLCRSLSDGRVFDMPEHAFRRYVARASTASNAVSQRKSEPARGGERETDAESSAMHRRPEHR